MLACDVDVASCNQYRDGACSNRVAQLVLDAQLVCFLGDSAGLPGGEITVCRSFLELCFRFAAAIIIGILRLWMKPC